MLLGPKVNVPQMLLKTLRSYFHEPHVAQAAGGKVKSPTGTAPDRYVYYPGTETLGKDEIRIIAHEFDYKGENQVVYRKNGVTVRSWPAIHAGDGPVSFSLKWKGYKVVFGGDTFPNSWFIKYAKNADIVIHEAMLTADQLRVFYNQPPTRTIMMNTDCIPSAELGHKRALS